MVVDPANAAAIYANNREQRLVAPTVSEEQVSAQERQTVSGQTSETGPAVVTNFSATALQTSRAVNEPDQSADQDKSKNVTERQQQLNLQEQQEEDNKQSPSQQTIDLVV